MNPTLELKSAASRAWRNLLTWRPRATRTEFVMAFIGTFLLQTAMSDAANRLIAHFGGIAFYLAPSVKLLYSPPLVFITVPAIIISLALTYICAVACIRRSHDLNVNAWYFLGYVASLLGLLVTINFAAFKLFNGLPTAFTPQVVYALVNGFQAWVVVGALGIFALALLPGSGGANAFGSKPATRGAAPAAKPVAKPVAVAAKPAAKAAPVAAKPAPKAVVKTAKAAPKKAAPKGKVSAKSKPAAKGKKK